MARKKTNVALIRGLIIGAVALLGIVVVGYGVLYSQGVTQGEFVAGEHYTVLENAERRRPGAPIKVQEFFSYACIHCKNFQPDVDSWLPTKPDNVVYERVPVVFSPAWGFLAQTYYTFETLDVLDENHDRMFRAIHNARRSFSSPEDLAEFVDGNGASAEEFLEAFKGGEVRLRVRNGTNLQRDFGISATPTLVVAGKYMVTMDVGPAVALEVVDHLIALESGEAPASPG
ncbi:MAG: thiol:disulfide interchange protein DsbA/DsbL [Pseudomonadota bacterium]